MAGAISGNGAGSSAGEILIFIEGLQTKAQVPLNEREILRLLVEEQIRFRSDFRRPAAHASQVWQVVIGRVSESALGSLGTDDGLQTLRALFVIGCRYLAVLHFSEKAPQNSKVSRAAIWAVFLEPVGDFDGT
jgi:hypothetical protein